MEGTSYLNKVNEVSLHTVWIRELPSEEMALCSFGFCKPPFGPFSIRHVCLFLESPTCRANGSKRKKHNTKDSWKIHMQTNSPFDDRGTLEATHAKKHADSSFVWRPAGHFCRFPPPRFVLSQILNPKRGSQTMSNIVCGTHIHVRPQKRWNLLSCRSKQRNQSIWIWPAVLCPSGFIINRLDLTTTKLRSTKHSESHCIVLRLFYPYLCFNFPSTPRTFVAWTFCVLWALFMHSKKSLCEMLSNWRRQSRANVSVWKGTHHSLPPYEHGENKKGRIENIHSLNVMHSRYAKHIRTSVVRRNGSFPNLSPRYSRIALYCLRNIAQLIFIKQFFFETHQKAPKHRFCMSLVTRAHFILSFFFCDCTTNKSF